MGANEAMQKRSYVASDAKSHFQSNLERNEKPLGTDDSIVFILPSTFVKAEIDNTITYRLRPVCPLEHLSDRVILFEDTHIPGII